MKILITGANGMLARATIKHCREIGDEVIAKTRQELDIVNEKAVFELFEREHFDAVLNCAAYTNVDGAETDQTTCYQVNVDGVGNLAKAAKHTNSAFVTVSTDYVFDGTKSGFYTQRDETNPQGFYAYTKREGETTARIYYARSIIVRSGWIFGKDGTNFLSVMDKLLAEGKSIKAISDSYGTPTYADDLAKRLRELAALDLPAIYHVTNSGEATTFEKFAQEVCRLKGYDKNLIQSVSMTDLKRPAPRPANSPLNCLFSERFGLSPLPDWQNALSRFLNAGQK